MLTLFEESVDATLQMGWGGGSGGINFFVCLWTVNEVGSLFLLCGQSTKRSRCVFCCISVVE